MRKWKLAAGATVASGALAIGMFAAFTLTAKAGPETDQGCSASYTGTVAETSPLTCTATDTAAEGKAIPYPLSITLDATTSTSASPNADAGFPVDYSWTSACTEQNLASPVSAKGTIDDVTTSVTLLPEIGTGDTQLNVLDPTTCDLTVTVTVTGDGDLAATELALSVTDDESAAGSSPSPTSSPTPSPSASASSSAPGSTTTYYHNQVQGFDGTCLDDRGNSSAERAEVILWSCSDTDQAQGWAYSGSELKIHGLCVNAKGNGKSGSRLILWKCVGSGNEIFSHRSDGEYAEKANGWSMCINDPAYSTKNGTQLFVYKCNNGANEHFSTP
jgi:hypothetical protein